MWSVLLVLVLVLALSALAPVMGSVRRDVTDKDLSAIRKWDELLSSPMRPLRGIQKWKWMWFQRKGSAAIEVVMAASPAANSTASAELFELKLLLGQYDVVLDLFHADNRTWRGAPFLAIHQRAQDGHQRAQRIRQAFEAKNWAAAKSDIDQLLAGSSLFTDMLLLRCWCLYHLGEYLPAAETLLHRVLPVVADHVDAMHLLGLAYYQLGQLEHSSRVLERCLELRGDHAGCSVQVVQTSKLLDLHRRLRGAIASNTAAVSLGYLQEILAAVSAPDHQNLAVAWQAQKQIAKLHIARRSLSEAHKLLRSMLLPPKAGQTQAASASIAAAAAAASDPEVHMMHAKVLEVVHDFDQARSAYATAMAMATAAGAQTVRINPLNELSPVRGSGLSSFVAPLLSVFAPDKPSLETGVDMVPVIRREMDELARKEALWNRAHTYYDVLSISTNASPAEIKKAHWEQSNYWNPHLRTVRAEAMKAEKMFMLVMEARSVLMEKHV